MAETKAEDEDDESFGDFTFASFPNQSVLVPKNSTTTTTAADDDEWGDFVESPLGSEHPSGPSHTQSSLNPSSQSLQSGVELGNDYNNINNNQWVKPKGALPLSLFGEEEEESRVVDPSVGDVKVNDSFPSKYSNGNVENVSNFQSGGAGFDDIIANLYGQGKQIKPENGFSSNSDGSNLNSDGKNSGVSVVNLDSNTNASLLTPSGVSSNLDLAGNGNGNSDIFTDLYNRTLKITAGNGFNSSSNKMGWNSNGLSSNLQGLSFNGSSSNLQGLNFNGSSSNWQGLNASGSSSNLQGLNFNRSSSNLQGLNANGSSSNLQVLNANGSSSNLEGLNANASSSNLQGLNFNGLSSNLQGSNANGLSSNLQGLYSNGSNSNMQGLNANGSSSNLQGLNSNGSSSNLQGLNANGSSSNLQGLSLNGLSSNLKGLNSNGSSSNLQGLNSSFNGLNLNSGSMGGNEGFEAARNSESKVGIMAENGFISDSNKLDYISNASNSNLRDLDWNFSGLNSNSGLTGGKEEIEDDDEDDDDDDDGWEFKVAYSEGKIGDGITTESGFTSNSNKLDANSNASTSNLRGLDSNSNRLDLNSESGSGNQKFNADDDGWGFKDAYPESKTINGSDKGPVALELSGPELQSKWEIGREMQVDQKEHGNSEVTTYSSGFGNGLGGPVDLFSDSNGVSCKPHEDIGFDFKSSKVAETGSLSDLYFQNGAENRLDSHPPVQHDDSDESFGDFKAAFSKIESKCVEEPNISTLSSSEVEVPAIDGKNQGNQTRPENNKGPVPLSIFGDEELETTGSSSIQDDFTFKPASFHRKAQSQGSSLSLDDLFELYGQSEPVNSVDSLEKPTENGLDSADGVLDSTDGVLDSKLVDAGGDFEDDSWEFKDAVTPTMTKDQTSLLTLSDAPQNISTKTNLNDHVDFYSKLKDELCSVARHHLHCLKQAQSSATLSGEDTKVAALDEEIQEACEELHQENIIYEEAHSEDNQPRDISLKEFLEVLNEPKFQVLESEYYLSRRLSMAEKDFRSAVELIKHATTMLKILTLVSLEEQSSYVSTWSKMLSVCAEELKHGAWIWKQSLEKNVHSRIISEPQGKRFIIAIGEIYRVVVILGASVKLYRPWILSSCSVDSTSICTLLEECHTLWSSSGLEEILPTISDPVGSKYNGTANALAESIKRIHSLDAFALGNHVFSQQESVCRLSVLTPGVVPDMKTVVWDGEYYFLVIANLWANLISCEPPKLPCLQFG